MINMFHRILSNDGFSAFHYKSYGTFSVLKKLHNILSGFTHYRYYRALVLLFIVYFGLARHFGINISGEVSAVIVFSMWGMAEMGDLVRGAITSLPKHQFESGQALGLSKFQLYFYIIIPQVVRRLLPQAINLITRMIKTTSLVVLIGVIEVVKVGQQIIDSNRLTIPTASIWVYGWIFILYFLVCYPVSRLSLYLEKNLED